MAVFGVLFFVWPIPHTIAFRNVLMFFLFVWTVKRSASLRARPEFAQWQQPLWALGIFTAWLFVGLFFTPFWRDALHAISSQWFSALGSLLLGAVSGVAGGGFTARKTAILFTAVLCAHVFAVDVQGFLWIVHHGHFPAGLNGRRDGGLTAGPDKSNYLTNFLLDLLVAELSIRLEGQRFFPVGQAALATAFVLAILSSYLEGMRNGLIDILLLTMFLAIRFIYINRANFSALHRLSAASLLFVAAALVGLDLRFDSRWDTLFATIPIAWNTELYRTAWINPSSPLPLLPNGHAVSQSNYLRIAWIKEGFKSMLDFPLGLGYGRSVFGKALLLRFGKGAATATSTNNGILNLGLGVGFPGLIFWYLWYGSTVRKAITFFNGASAFWGRALFLVLLDVGTRNLVDANLQDYMLEQFFFLIGLLATGAAVSAASAPHRVGAPEHAPPP